MRRRVVFFAPPSKEADEMFHPEVKVGGLVFCPMCGERNEVTMSFRGGGPEKECDGDGSSNNNNNIFTTTRSNRFHCSSCGSNVEFKLIWDWDIDKIYR